MPNRLSRETSPYLLQHAHNPVDWYPWGDEALDLARREDRPILLSIGYSACHWCHVMERESFEDDATAELMNRLFVNIKVDREERPDVDSIYMRAVQTLTGQGGWPLTVFLTPDTEPYYGGTYFPPEPRHGLPSFRQVLEATADAYSNRRDAVTKASSELVAVLRKASEGTGPPPAGEGEDIGRTLARLDEAVRFFSARFDPRFGGFGRAPKFPQPATLEFLLRWWRWRSLERTPGDGPDSKQALHMVVETLRAMDRGGIHDQLAGGFHRYSVDERWLVPHFEKMLYDNALLARVYADAGSATGDLRLSAVAASTLEWILEDMRSPEGGFYSALDADSEGVEGRYYVWRPEQLAEVLGEEEARRFGRIFDITEFGNFEGDSIPHRPHDLEALARAEGLPLDAFQEWVRGASSRLLEARRERIAPARDEKILAAWNGFTIRALAEAGATLDRPDFVEAAVQALHFILDAMTEDDRLLRVFAAGRAHVPAFLEDWAAVGNAALSLYSVTLDGRWLRAAGWASEAVVQHFYDEASGHFYDTAADAEPLLVRPREVMDNATPSGVSLAIELLQRCGRLFEDEEWAALARRALRREASMPAQLPSAFGRRLALMVAEEESPIELVLCGPQDDDFRHLHAAALEGLQPARLVVGPYQLDEVTDKIDLLRGKEPVDGRPTAYLCRDRRCLPPITSPGELRLALANDDPG